MPIKRSDLPFGSEFSPAQIDLREVLEIAKNTEGDWRAFEDGVRATYFEGYKTSDYNRGKLANNTRLGMIAYGIVDREGHLTELGNHLWDLREDESRLYEVLARHILLNLKGMTVVQCLSDIEAAGETATLIILRQWLGERGVHFPRGGRHPSTMRAWLEKAGIFHPSSWRVNQARLKEVASVDTSDFDALASLSPEQRAFLRTLVNITEPGPFQSNQLEKLASATYGIRFNEKNLAKDVLYPLEKAGYISLTRGTKAEGRGAKPFSVEPTEDLKREFLEPLLDQLAHQIGMEVLPLLRRPLGEIIAELDVNDRHRRGLALEALAFKLTRLLDLEYVGTRLRGTVTGGAEVDLVVQSARLIFSRWQIQCKNVSGGVTLDDVAKEVGLTHMLKSNVVMVVSTGRIGPQARRYANRVMQQTNLQIALLSGEDLAEIVQNPTRILDVLNREASHALQLKALDEEHVQGDYENTANTERE